MLGLGWLARYDKNYFFGCYIPIDLLYGHKRQTTLKKWMINQSSIAKMANEYHDRFNKLFQYFLERLLLRLNLQAFQNLGDLDFNGMETRMDAFVSNFTFTMNNSSNSYHQDHNYNTQTYGLWALVQLNFGELATILDGFTCEGRQFAVASYKVYVDFGSCDGIVKIIWRGNQYHQRTLPNQTIGNFTTIGTSCQTSKRLKKAIAKAHIKKEARKDMDDKHKNVGKLYQQCSREN